MIVTNKSILARLMATENLTVEQRAVETASFNMKTRTLTIPIMKEGLSEDVLDLMIGHEISHGLETPMEGWHHSVVDLKIHRGILNICEDVRIEKKLKRRYPGIKGSMHRGYKTLLDQNFFGTVGEDLNKMGLADRINLHCKLGSLATISFLPVEQALLDAIEAAETFDETVLAARNLQKYMEETNTNMGSEDGDLKYEYMEGKGKPGDMCSTDSAFRKREKELYDEKASDNQYTNIPEMNLENIVIPYKEILGKLSEQKYNLGKSDQYALFLKDSNKVVSYLVKEFEMKKNAKQFLRNRVATSGSLDMKKVHSYRTREDLFRQITISDNGKSHGLILFVDWSGSMLPHIRDTIEQILSLTLFCKKVGIPFEVYAFTNADIGTFRTRTSNRPQTKNRVDDLFIPEFHLMNLLSSTMNSSQFSSMASFLLTFQQGTTNSQLVPNWLQLSGTPLNESIIAAIPISENYRKDTRLDILSVVFITDGEGPNLHKKFVGKGVGFENISPSKRVRSFIRDKKTQTTLELKPGQNMSKQLLEILKIRSDVNTVGFFVAPARHIKATILGQSGTEEMVQEFKKKHYLAMKNTGYDEYYMIRSIRIDEAEYEFSFTSMTARGIATAFTEHHSNKLSHRVILSRFITIIS